MNGMPEYDETRAEPLCRAGVLLPMDENSMTDELALLAALQRDISGRLRPVCGDMTEEQFEALVREIAAVKIKYGDESYLMTSLKSELTTIMRDDARGGEATSPA